MKSHPSMRSDFTNDNACPILCELLLSIKIRDEDLLSMNVF